MLKFDECPVCSGNIVEKEVTKVITSSNKQIPVKLPASVCCKCSEQFFSLDSVKKLEQMRSQLER